MRCPRAAAGNGASAATATVRRGCHCSPPVPPHCHVAAGDCYGAGFLPSGDNVRRSLYSGHVFRQVSRSARVKVVGVQALVSQFVLRNSVFTLGWLASGNSASGNRINWNLPLRMLVSYEILGIGNLDCVEDLALEFIQCQVCLTLKLMCVHRTFPPAEGVPREPSRLSEVGFRQ